VTGLQSASIERPGATRWSIHALTMLGGPKLPDEILDSLDAAQRETLYGLLALASNGQHTDCATAVSETGCARRRSGGQPLSLRVALRSGR
jgi:hypothetical protein